MTENKAIEELHRIRPYGGIIPQRRAEALDVAIKAVFEWFMHKHDLNCPDGEYQIRFPGTPYVLSMRKEEKGGEENDAH